METNEKKDDAYSLLLKDVKEYAHLQFDMLRLVLIEKLSQIISLIVVLFIGAILILASFIYFSMAFVHWMSTIFGSMIPGFLILGGFFVILFAVFYKLKTSVFLNPIVKKLSSILFKDLNNSENHE
jgi:hypothetical protein